MNSLEIERKFIIDHNKSLIHTDTFPVNIKYKDLYIRQYYLYNSSQNVSERIRGSHEYGFDNKYYHTIKTFVSAGINDEKEIEISKNEFDLLRKRKDENTNFIDKVRRVFVLNDLKYELDFFNFPVKNLVILEVELKDIDQDLPIPDFIKIIKEVTNDKNFSNHNLSKLAIGTFGNELYENL